MDTNEEGSVWHSRPRLCSLGHSRGRLRYISLVCMEDKHHTAHPAEPDPNLMTIEELYRCLEEGLKNPARVRELEQDIWNAVGATRAILVTDLSGFTKITKEHGILHFLATFRQVVLVAEPIFAGNRVVFCKTSADNMMATFRSAAEAVAVARELVKIRVDQVRVCVGIGCGPVVELEDDVFGDEVNVAYKLGEDIAGPGEVLLSQAAANTVQDLVDGPLTVAIGGIDLPYHRLRT